MGWAVDGAPVLVVRVVVRVVVEAIVSWGHGGRVLYCGRYQMLESIDLK
jgi:hypothetical protein